MATCAIRIFICGDALDRRMEVWSNMSEIKAVIFDIDNTLYSYTDANKAGRTALFEYMKNRFGTSEEESAALFEKCFAAQKMQLGKNAPAVHSRLIRFQLMLDEIKKPAFPHALNMAHAYWDTFLDNMKPEDGIADLMRALRLRGIKVAVGTNMTAYIQYEKITKLGLGQYIDRMVTSEEAGVDKPDMRFYLYLLKTLVLAPEECLFIGDNVIRDYKASMDAGLKAAWYAGHPGGHPAEEAAAEDKIMNFKDCLESGGIRLGNIFIKY